MAIFPLSDGPDAGAPGSRGLDCVQRPHNLFGNAEVLPHYLPTASREKAPFIAIRTVNAMANISSVADGRNRWVSRRRFTDTSARDQSASTLPGARLLSAIR